MPASGIEAVGRVGEADGDAEADAPGRNGHELRLDGLDGMHVSKRACMPVEYGDNLILPCIRDP